MQLGCGSTRISQCCWTLRQSLMGCFCNSAIFISFDDVCAVVSKIRNNPFIGICFDAKWNLPFLKSISFGSISEIGCPLLVAAMTPLFTAHSHLLPLFWTCSHFGSLDFASQLYSWCLYLNWGGIRIHYVVTVEQNKTQLLNSNPSFIRRLAKSCEVLRTLK